MTGQVLVFRRKSAAIVNECRAKSVRLGPTSPGIDGALAATMIASKLPFC
jgi:hypothetical protein